ncbi:MAG: hypothetical protein PHU14_14335 [Methylovulum sp.]|nr:hypothetical protein [Methylovulum sp.]
MSSCTFVLHTIAPPKTYAPSATTYCYFINDTPKNGRTVEMLHGNVLTHH